MGGKMIKERIKVIKIHNSFNYFEKMIKFFNRR